MKCIICERRPARDGAYCPNCNQKIEAEKRRAEPEKPVKFLTYRGHVVGLYRNGNGRLTPQLLQRSPENLPKSQTLNLNTYIPGFSREQIKKFKACVLQLAA
jgi:hypothetical protein